MKKTLLVLSFLLIAAIGVAQTPANNDGIELIPYTPTFPSSCDIGYPCGVFTDVTAFTFAAGWINDLGVEGISVGCGGGAFCPDANTTRAQEAVFIIKALHHKHTDGGTGATVITGVYGPCEDDEIGNTGGVQSCRGTVHAAGITPETAIVATYFGELGAAGGRPIAITAVGDGYFEFQVKDGTSFFWMAAPLPPVPQEARQ